MPISIFGNRTLEKLYFSSENQPTVPAVAVMKESGVIGHVPYNISSALSMFLRQECNLQVVWANHVHSKTSTNHTVATGERTFVIQVCRLTVHTTLYMYMRYDCYALPTVH